MTSTDSQLSSYLAIKGPFVETTYRAFQDWDLSTSVKENLKRIEDTNSVGASSTGWLKQFTQVTKRRYELGGADRPLIELVQNGWHIDEWSPIQLWHMCQSDELLRVFLVEWLFDRHAEGIVIITVDAVVAFLHGLVKKQLGKVDAWKENTYRRVASGLLRTTAQFHLMRGRVNKEFEAYRLPERSLIYLLHAVMEREGSTRKVVDASDWRLFLLSPNEIEEELLRLHQFGKLRFERAGSFLELTLPCESTSEYVRSAAV